MGRAAHINHLHRKPERQGLRLVPALIDMLEQHHAENFGWAMSCCHYDSVLAADVLQEAYLRVLDGRARFQGNSREQTWFFGVIRLIALEERRSRWRRWLPGVTRADESLSADDIEDNATAATLRTALSQLPDRQRQVLHLVFYTGATLEETANIMQLSIGSVRTHYHRGKARLGNLLAETDE